MKYLKPSVLLAFLLTFTASAAGQAIPPAVTYSVSYDYDAAGRLIEAEWENNLTTTYDYDAAGRLVAAVQSPFSGVGIVPSDSELPTEFSLRSAYPNPFSSTTTVSFDLPVPSSVRVRVVDLVGRVVAILADEPFDAGRHALVWDAARFGSGSYIIELNSDGRRFSRLVAVAR
ncbi:MAG: RHS repeat protein [Rhodothermales bacterium]|nr:RHS repeat protein [Rhodothermales bacterium]